MNHWHTAASLQQSHRAELARDAAGGHRLRREGLAATEREANRPLVSAQRLPWWRRLVARRSLLARGVASR